MDNQASNLKPGVIQAEKRRPCGNIMQMSWFWNPAGIEKPGVK